MPLLAFLRFAENALGNIKRKMISVGFLYLAQGTTITNSGFENFVTQKERRDYRGKKVHIP